MAFQNLVRHLVFPVKFSGPKLSDFQFHWENGFRVRVFTYTKNPNQKITPRPRARGRRRGGAARAGPWARFAAVAGPRLRG